MVQETLSIMEKGICLAESGREIDLRDELNAYIRRFGDRLQI